MSGARPSSADFYGAVNGPPGAGRETRRLLADGDITRSSSRGCTSSSPTSSPATTAGDRDLRHLPFHRRRGQASHARSRSATSHATPTPRRSSYSIQSLRLTPAAFEGQRVARLARRVPGFCSRAAFKDAFGNAVHLVTITPPPRDRDQGRRHGRNQRLHGVVAGLPRPRRRRVFLTGDRRRHGPTPPSASLPPRSKAQDLLDRLHALAGVVRERVEYVVGSTDAHTAPPKRSPTARACARTTPTSSSRRRAARRPGPLRDRLSRHRTAKRLRCAPRLGGGLDRRPRLARLRPRQPRLPDRALRAPRRRPRCAACRPIIGSRRGGATRSSTSPSKSSSRAAPSSSDPRSGALDAWSSRGLADDLLRRTAAQPRAGVRRRYAHQRRRRQRRPVSQAALLAQAGRARDGAADGGQPGRHPVGRQPAQRAARRGAAPGADQFFKVPSLYRAARLVGDAVREVRGRRRRRWKTTKPASPPPSSSAARSAPRRRACSRSIPKATSSRRPTTRRSSRSASTNTASRSSTGWRSRPCGSARRRSWCCCLRFHAALQPFGRPADRHSDVRARQPRCAAREAHLAGRRIFPQAVVGLVRGAALGFCQDRRVQAVLSAAAW